MELEETSAGKGGGGARRKRIELHKRTNISDQIAVGLAEEMKMKNNYVSKLKKSYVSVVKINVEREQERLKVCEKEVFGQLDAVGRDEVETVEQLIQVKNKDLIVGVDCDTVGGNDELELEVCRSSKDSNDSVEIRTDSEVDKISVSEEVKYTSVSEGKEIDVDQEININENETSETVFKDELEITKPERSVSIEREPSPRETRASRQKSKLLGTLGTPHNTKFPTDKKDESEEAKDKKGKSEETKDKKEESEVDKEKLSESTRRAPSSRISMLRATRSDSPPPVQTSPTATKFVSVKTGRVFEKHPCMQCEKVFSSAKGLQFHNSSHLLQCKVCSITLPSSQQLKTHTEQHITNIADSHPAQFQCKVCGKEFSVQNRLKKHTQLANVHTRPFSCSLETCDRTFTRLAHLSNHRQIHPDQRHLHCEKCTMRFSRQDYLDYHQKLVNCGRERKVPAQGVTVKQFQCLECPKSFSSSQFLDMHQYYHWDTTDRALPCMVNICTERFSTRYKLERHMEEHSSIVKDRMFVCAVKECDKRFSDPVQLQGHIEYHMKEVVCRKCSVQFDSKLDMLLHRVICMEKEKQEVFSCKVCRKNFKAKRFLDNHVKLCGKLKPAKKLNQNKCDRCGKVFDLKHKFQEHVANAHTEDPPLCIPQVLVKGITKSSVHSLTIGCDFPGCDKTFNRYILLKNHLYSHTDNPFSCMQECQLSFSQLSSYQQHCRAEHAGNFGFLNCDKCDQVFTVESHMENHMEKFHEKSIDLAIFDDAQFYDKESGQSVPFPCKHSGCGDTFSLRSQLRTHYMTHDPLANTCTECDSKFNDRTSLTKHRVVDHQLVTPPVFCPFCQDSFLSTQYLRIHLLSVHPPPWSCPHTGCTFSPTYLLEASIHMQTHLVKTCDWPACGQNFQTRELLLSHFQQHTETLLSCPVQSCSFICCMAAVFEKHLEQHMEEKVFSCHACSYHSYNIRQLECHLESGHKQRPKPHEFTSEVNLPCSVQGCGATFVQENLLLKHQRSVHGRVVTSRDSSESVMVETETEVDITFVSELETDIDKSYLLGSAKPKNIVINLSSDSELAKDQAGESLENRTRMNPSQSTPPSASPQLDNSLVNTLTPGTPPGPPLASSPLKVDHRPSEVLPEVVIDSSVIIVELSDKVFTESSGDIESVIVPPVVRKHAEEEENRLYEEQPSKDIVVEEIVEADVESEDDQIEENSKETVESFDASSVVVNTEFVEEDVIEPAILAATLTHDDIAVCDKPKTSLVENEAVENVKTEPSEPEEAKISHQLKKSALHSLYSSVVTTTIVCPNLGQFISLLAIDQNMLENTVVPELLEPVDESSLCKGLAIDLLELQQQSGVSHYLLAGYIRELLPVGLRPRELEPAVVQQMVSRLTKMKVQASRFRARYKDFPLYLNKYLIELCNPFT
eukprot:GFUD01037629.1.p1 GENE.GFUD01037629.1~~GFUD01037629.1.p1  ORF type:complete len:1416 (+),score=457.14 GFUD01037629.1:117-4364(+)